MVLLVGSFVVVGRERCRFFMGIVKVFSFIMMIRMVISGICVIVCIYYLKMFLECFFFLVVLVFVFVWDFFGCNFFFMSFMKVGSIVRVMMMVRVILMVVKIFMMVRKGILVMDRLMRVMMIVVLVKIIVEFEVVMVWVVDFCILVLLCSWLWWCDRMNRV